MDSKFLDTGSVEGDGAIKKKIIKKDTGGK